MAFLNETGLRTFLTNCDNRYLKKIGGTTTGRIYNTQNGSWIVARDKSPFYKGRLNDDNTFFPCIGMQTKNGSWSIGAGPGASDQLVFSYTSNTDYAAGTNSGKTYWLSTGGSFGITASNVSGTVAVGNGGTGATTWKAARENLGTYASTSAPSNQGTSWAGTIWVQY